MVFLFACFCLVLFISLAIDFNKKVIQVKDFSFLLSCKFKYHFIIKYLNQSKIDLKKMFYTVREIFTVIQFLIFVKLSPFPILISIRNWKCWFSISSSFMGTIYKDTKKNPKIWYFFGPVITGNEMVKKLIRL